MSAAQSTASVAALNSSKIVGRLESAKLGESALGELGVKLISSAFILIAKGLETQTFTDALSECCRASASIVESQVLANAIGSSLRLVADVIQHEGLVHTIADSLAATARTLDHENVHAMVDRTCRTSIAILQRSLALTSAALESESVMKSIGCLIQAYESETVQKIAETGSRFADAAMQSKLVRKTVVEGHQLVKAVGQNELLQRSASRVGDLATRVACNETVQSTAGAAGNCIMRAAQSGPVQALSKPVQVVGSKSLDLATSTTVQNAATRLWNLALTAEEKLHSGFGWKSDELDSERVALAEAVSRRSGVTVTANTLDARMGDSATVRAALLEEALEAKRAVMVERVQWDAREAALVEEIDRMRCYQRRTTTRLAELEVAAVSTQAPRNLTTTTDEGCQRRFPWSCARRADELSVPRAMLLRSRTSPQTIVNVATSVDTDPPSIDGSQ